MPLYLGDKLISGQSREIAEKLLEGDIRLVPGGVIKKYVDSNTISPSGGTITGPLEIAGSSVKTSSNGNVAYLNPGLKYWGESNLTGTLVLNFGSDAAHMAADVILANQKVNAILCLNGYAATNGFSWARATGLVGGLELKVRTAGDANGNHYFLIGEVNTDWGGYLQSNVTNLLKHVEGSNTGSCVGFAFVTDESAFTNVKEVEVHGGEIPSVESLNAVPQTRKINGKTLEADITLSAADVNARSDTWMPSATDVGARPNTWTPTATDVGAVPVTRKINGVALSADVTLDADDVGARANTWLPTASQVGAVPTTRKVNNKALSADITLTAADVGVANPNLLDNWYFADPIDQRGGYVVPPNTDYYRDSALTDKEGYTSGYRAVKELTSTYCAWAGINGVTYYAPASVAIRGYIGTGYGIDRWKFTENSISMTKFDGGIELDGSNTWTALTQNLDHAYSGKNITIAILVSEIATPDAWQIVVRNNDKWADKSISGPGLYYKTFAVPDDAEDNVRVMIQTKASNAGKIKVVAVKLELGSTQTLAHQDENGNWVLNDPPPDKSMELLKCIQSTADSADTYANKVIYHTGNKPTAADIGAHDIKNQGTAIKANDDLNSYTTPGVYYSSGSAITNTVTNRPYSDLGFRMIVERGYTSGSVVQTIQPFSTVRPLMFRVYYLSGSSYVWTPWRTVYDSSILFGKGGLLNTLFPTQVTPEYIPIIGSNWNTAGFTTLEGLKTALGTNSSGGHVVSDKEPTNTNLLWIDTANGGVLKYYDGSAWVGVKGVWG
jgi:hypothetical protein